MATYAKKTEQDLYNDRKMQSNLGLRVSTDLNDYKKMYGGDLTGMAFNYKRTDIKDPDPDPDPDPNPGSGGSDLSALYAQQMAAYQSLLDQQRARAEEAARQKQAAAQAAYDKNMGYLTDAYARRGELLQGNYNDTLAQLQEQYDYGARGVNENADRAQQQAYLNYMLSKRDLPQQLAALGINGGASESRLAGLYNSYGNARNAVDTGRNGDLASLLNTLNQNKSSALQAYNSALSDDDARRLAYQMELEQNLANGTAQILSDKYDALNNLDSTYTQQMAALQQAQAQAAAKAAQSGYSAGNEGSLLNTERAQAALASAAKAYRSAVGNGFNSSQALDKALDDLYTSAWELGLDDATLEAIAAQIARG